MIEQLVQAQRAFFATGTTRDVAWRKAQLRALNTSLKKWERTLCDALWKDLHKSYEEAFMTEIGLVYGEIGEALRNVSRWARRRRRPTTLPAMPSQSYIVREPLGCTLIVSPWNYPVQLLLSPLVGAIGAGCTAILKPSPYVPTVSQALEEMIRETFPKEYVAVVQGNRDVNTELFRQRYDLLFLTGSPSLAKVAMAAQAPFLTPMVLELGGKSPCIVDREADLHIAARRIAWGKCLNSGQTCIAPDYLFLHEDIKDAFVQAFKEELAGLYPDGTEHSDKYVEPLDPLYFTGENYHFVYRTANRDGYRQLYLCDTLGTVRRITSCEADVAISAVRGSSIFYTSAEVSPVENHLFRIDLTPAKGRKASKVEATRIGKPLRLTSLRGWHNVAVSLDGGWFLDRWSSFNDPGGVAVVSTDGKGREKFRRAFPDPLADYATGEIEFGTVPSADGSYDNYYRLFKPADFDPEKKYPVVLYVYGGPHSQMVTDSWLGGVRLWEVLMAQRGYVVYVQDGRGTQNRGLAYEQAIHRRCGQAEMADQMVGIRRLMAEPWVDCDRIGVHGWSYGGFMTISLMTSYPDVFKVGVAGGPVIDWKWYEIMYGERYMETEETNPEGFAQTSLIGKAGDLKGHLLICQGAIDNTVVWQHSLSFIQACIDTLIPVDYFPYPVAEHNVFGDNRVHLMDKVTRYFEDYL